MINLLGPPFNLNGYVELISEETRDKKHLVLYDIPNYLSRVDFDRMLVDSLAFGFEKT
jgi:hypothetical protein